MRQEKIMKRLMGKADVKDALQRLDLLTQEENLTTVARTFEATHHVDTKVTVIEEVLQQVDGNVEVIKEGTRTIDNNVKLTKAGAHVFQFLHTYTDHPLLYIKTVMDDLRRSSLLHIILIVEVKMCL